MINFFFIGKIAFYEAKLLFRSWGFRIFSGIALIFLVVVHIAIVSRSIPTPYYISSLSGSLPLNSLKFFNIFQGVVVAFMATEFFKRDRRQDSVQVIFSRSFSNVGYFLGKALGILSVFLLLNLAVLAITFVFHFFFSSTVFALKPYLLYTLLISLPTLIFMIGLAFFLSSLLRNQALVLLILLAYSFLVLVFLGAPFFGLFDSYAFYLPLMYSDFIGLGNIHSTLLIRLSYLFLGLGFFFVSPLLFKRLRQSKLSNTITGSLSLVCLVLALFLGTSYMNGKYADRTFRQQLRISSQKFKGKSQATVQNCDIQLEHRGETISAAVTLNLLNETPSALDNILLTLNPGFKVDSVTQGGGPLDFQQDGHLLHVTPKEPVYAEDSISLTVSYSGKIDERYCFLDIDNNRYESRYRLWIYDIPKHYAFITPDFVHLTPESGWYPISGLPPGAAYPAVHPPGYSQYTLEVTAPAGQTAISQGKPETQAQGDTVQHIFKPEVPLPKMSLTIGAYQHHEIEIDNLTYSIYVRPGHDYFTPLMDQIHVQDGQGSVLEDLIRRSLDQMEVSLGVYYPYKRLSLVEVPINICSYHRLWTVAHETVQPQLTYIPEMATICAYGQLRFPLQQEERLRGRKVPVAWSGIQRGVLWRFINWNLIGNTDYMDPVTADTVDRMRHNRIGLNVNSGVETQFTLFPNFFSFKSQVYSPQWPVLNYALESYLQEIVTTPQPMFGQESLSGLSRDEEINQQLQNRSLAAMIEDPDFDPSIVQGALQAKGKTLLALIEAEYEGEDFSKKFKAFLNRQKFGIISGQDLMDFLSGLGNIDLNDIVGPWYTGTEIPGFVTGGVETYDVIEGERQRTQVKFLIANPTDADGITKISLRERPVRGGPAPEIYSRAFIVPARTTIEAGFVTDKPPVQMVVDTFVSQNVPASLNIPFWQTRVLKEETPFRGETSKPYDRTDFFPANEIIVDNADPGFEILGTAKKHWLSRSLEKLLNIKDKPSAYTAMNIQNPPGIWSPTTYQDFYGEFILSAHLKKSGQGKERVQWKMDIAEEGEYDIYFYHGLPSQMGVQQQLGRGGQQSGRSPSRAPGQKFFSISSRNGMEEVEVDLENSEDGWNLIGTFPLEAGPNKIELSDKNDAGFVLADAVKWVKK
jgi:ABC-type transport system involved in multi-copper enzyme maturation permease subunit